MGVFCDGRLHCYSILQDINYRVKMMNELANWIKNCCEYLGGESDHMPKSFPLAVDSLFWGIWWGVLLCVIIVFCGQTSKFIYIDF